MADPTTLSAISLGATAGGGLLSAFGAASKGEAEGKMYDYQSGVAKINKQIAQQNAEYSRQTGEVEAEQSGIKTRQQVGGIITAKAASGIDVGSGSAKDVVESQHDVGQHDQAIIRSNAARRAFGYEVEAVKDESQAQAYGAAASKSRQGGVIGALSSILGTAGSVAGKWLDASRVGIGSTPALGLGKAGE